VLFFYRSPEKKITRGRLRQFNEGALEMKIPDEIPGNVERIIVYPNGEKEFTYAPFTVANRWPGIIVNSSRFKDLPVAEQFYERALAYLRAARVLCETAGQYGERLCWSDASVCLYTLEFATELFLKACIQRSGGKLDNTHDISRLYADYREILPEEEFEFCTQWKVSLKSVEKIVGAPIGNPIDHSPDQLHRYGVDRNGIGSAALQHFNPNYMFSYIEYLGSVWQRAWNKISEA
jgi:HEPN domain-containing protein